MSVNKRKVLSGDGMDAEQIRKEIAKELAVKGENSFVREVYAKDIREPLDILNWYRNLYYKEGKDTEQGLMAMTINDLFMKYKKELNLID